MVLSFVDLLLVQWQFFKTVKYFYEDLKELGDIILCIFVSSFCILQSTLKCLVIEMCCPNEPALLFLTFHIVACLPFFQVT